MGRDGRWRRVETRGGYKSGRWEPRPVAITFAEGNWCAKLDCLYASFGGDVENPGKAVRGAFHGCIFRIFVQCYEEEMVLQLWGSNVSFTSVSRLRTMSGGEIHSPPYSIGGLYQYRDLESHNLDCWVLAFSSSTASTISSTSSFIVLLTSANVSDVGLSTRSRV